MTNGSGRPLSSYLFVCFALECRVATAGEPATTLDVAAGGQVWPLHSGNLSAVRTAVLQGALLPAKAYALSYVDLDAAEEKSQSHRHDAVLQLLFDLVGAVRRTFVVIGSTEDMGSSGSSSSGHWLLSLGWHGVVVGNLPDNNDQVAPPDQNVVGISGLHALIQRANGQSPNQVDEKSLDLLCAVKSNLGPQVWAELGFEVRPRVVVLDGPSVCGIAELGREKGYSIVHMTRAGRMLFLRNDLLKELHYAHGVIFRNADNPSHFGLQRHGCGQP